MRLEDAAVARLDRRVDYLLRKAERLQHRGARPRSVRRALDRMRRARAALTEHLRQAWPR